MPEAVLSVQRAGPLVSYQDSGRFGMKRFGVPASGPMDRVAHSAANLAIGNQPGATAIEVSAGRLFLTVEAGEVAFAVAGGGFVVTQSGQPEAGAWTRGVLRQGETLEVRPGLWGNWCYLALAGEVLCDTWLGSSATHSLSGFGGGVLRAGDHIRVSEARGAGLQGNIPCPAFARPRRSVRIVMGPQDGLFSEDARDALIRETFYTTAAHDRMGMRLGGPKIAFGDVLSIPSEPVLRGSVQVAGDGVPTILMADHQTTGGYPKIATVLSCDLDAVSQVRPGMGLRFTAVSPAEAIAISRTASMARASYFDALARHS